MSSGQVSSHRSKSSHSKATRSTKQIPPQPTLTPENTDRELEPCAATASYLLYAQRNIVLCLHHDTLAIERRFDRHREDVRWISADTVSERGAGRLAVSYDAGHTAIVWDIATGDEISRFAAYEEIRVATWMRNGNIAFGNVQGNVILFEPSTSEHVSARTIYDPITAIAPVADNRTFAIGYLNGSILIATLQPFTMVHSLNTSSAPSRITGLAWHGSASRQKSDMLATQTADGNLKVWSIPKVANGDSPNIIRILNRPDGRDPGPCWFAWSKLGRIVQHSGGETRSWDVRTKNVTCEPIPTLDGIVGITNCGPTSTLFTLGSNHTVQQYDISPGDKPVQVASVRHAPANTPPSPPNSIEEQKDQGHEAVATLPTLSSVPIVYSDAETSESEGATMSPLARIAKEMDQLDDERRDRVGPLSPVSSRASSVSSNRSSDAGRRAPSYRYDKPASSRASNVSANEGTEFSFGPSIRQPARESISIRSTSSFSSSKYRSSGLRKEILRSPDEAYQSSILEIFPYVKARLANVPFRTPHYGTMPRTPDVLRKEMLSVVFGWNDDIELLIRDELVRHSPASTGGVLLAQWLGDLGADSMASMVGSESMTSADWMLLALSTMGHASQKKVGEAFVHRLLEKGDIHPAVAILLGLGEENDAIEVYVSRNQYMEAVLLTCLVFPSDWQRQSYLVRKWGEVLVAQGQPELAVRCFSCTSVESSEPWFSPRAQDSVFAAESEQRFNQPVLSPPLSPPSAGGSGRLRNSSLKLITSFGDKGVPLLGSSNQNTPMANMLGVGVTPIAESAVSPGGAAHWSRSVSRKERDPSSARTATPGGYARKRYPSQSAERQAQTPAETPLTAQRDFAITQAGGETTARVPSSHSRRTSSISSNERPQRLDPSNARKISNPERLPSPAQDVFNRLKDDSKPRNGSRERLPVTLQVQVYDTAYLGSATSPAQGSQLNKYSLQPDILSQDGTDLAKHGARSHDKSTESHQRETSESRGRSGKRYIRPAKRSPSSPVPMSPEEVAAATRAMAKQNAERTAMPQEPYEKSGQKALSRAGSRAPSQQRNRVGETYNAIRRGASQQREAGFEARSPSSAMPSSDQAQYKQEKEATQNESHSLDRVLNSGIHTHEQLLPRSELTSPVQDQRGPSGSGFTTGDISDESYEGSDRSRTGPRDQDSLTRKRLAARELEERRASLARRPSAPVIPLPGELHNRRPPMAPRYFTELGDSPHSFLPPMSGPAHGRSHTADPHEMQRFAPRMGGASASSTPIGLPATPRAMRHPYYMNQDSKEGEKIPAVPDIPNVDLTLTSSPQRHGAEAETDKVTPLLPNTVFNLEGPSSPQRAASVPLESSQYRSSPKGGVSSPSKRRGHSRRTSQQDNQLPTSPPFIRTSIDETLHDSSHVVVVDTSDDAVVLPELRHLATPPPPPPPPIFTPNTNSSSSSNLGVINIAIEEEGQPLVIDVPAAPTPETGSIDRAATTSPTSTHSHHRRGRNSVSEGISSRLRNAVSDRMRSTSRSRTNPPNAQSPVDSFKPPMPYETVLPPTTLMTAMHHPQQQQQTQRRESISSRRPQSPYEAGVAPEDVMLPPSRGGSAFQAGVLSGRAYTPVSAPREKDKERERERDVRANMPPETLQQGVYRPDNMI